MGYKKGDAQKGAPVDLNDINFRNKDVMRWTNPKQTSGISSYSSRLVGMKGFGSSPKVTRL